VRWLLLACLLCGGCGYRIAAGDSAIVLRSAAMGLEAFQTQVCLYVIGASGPFRGMAAVLAHGGATIESCTAMFPPDHPPLPSPPP